LRDSEQRVPFLGAIPLFGQLFKVRNSQKVKTNLMVFIRPKILRDGVQTAIETNSKYNYVRDQQLDLHGGKVPLLPFEKAPALPELATPPASAPEPAPATTSEPANATRVEPIPESTPPPADVAPPGGVVPQPQ
jgi:general secretion pathway protein D